MIPGQRLSTTPVRGQLLNPWSRDRKISQHWGPVQVQDASQGLLVKLWTLRAEGATAILSAPGSPVIEEFTRAVEIDSVNLAFDQNARPCICFEEEGGGVFLYWFDPVPNAPVFFPIPGDAVSPRITLDDAREFNIPNSDVILAYIRAGVLRYRRQRDRFRTEYTPPIGEGGSPALASSLRHVSMTSALRLEFMTDQGGGEEDWTLPMIIDDLAARANLPPERLGLKQLDWNQIVRGYMVSTGYGAHNALQHLSQVYAFDPCSADGRVNFVPRGRDAVASIRQADMIDDGEQIEERQDTRGDSISIPRVLHLIYYDVVGGLNTAKQLSERPDGTRAKGEHTLQTSVVMDADEAATCVAIQHSMMVEQQKGELNFSLPSKWIGLTESDAVHVEVGNRMVRAVIAKVSTGDGEQSYKLLRDRQSLYTVHVEGIPQIPPATPPSSVAGPTLIEVLDIPIQKDAHDQLGFYVAVSGAFPAWPGAAVDLSLDGGQTYIDGHTTRQGSVIGSLTTPLAAHPHEYPDTDSTCTVAIATPRAALENTTLAGMLNRRNRAAIGDEVVAFADADEVEPGTWELSHWLRGRDGTDAIDHPAGARFVLLDTALFVPAELSWLDRPLTFRAATLGRPLDEATIITITLTGRSQIERRPAYLRARREGDNAVISWQGVGRLGSGAHAAMGAYFDGYRVTIDDGMHVEEIDTTEQALAAPLGAFTGPVTIRVRQLNRLTGAGPRIEVTI